MKRLLFFAEAVTLAHLARPLAFLRTLPEEEWEIHLACPDNAFRRFLADFPHSVHTIHSTAPAEFQKALDWGRPLYDQSKLERYIAEDLELMHRVRPDEVMGDFRLSLSISARVAGIPYTNLANAYWRPDYAPVPPMPVLKQLSWLPRKVAEPIYRRAIGKAFAAHARPFNQLRQRHGLPSLPSDVRFFYTDGDTVLYADVATLFENLPLPAGHRFIGPLLWSPPVPDPPWWDDLPSHRPLLYLAIGSTGNPRIFKALLEILRQLPVTVMAAVGGREAGVSGNLYYAPWLDGIRASQRADLMIGNGGVMSCHQALAADIPVIGLCSNMDQMLSMQVMEENRRGWRVAADGKAPGMVRKRLEQWLLK
jgi:UDP:flavonoid glycosyltransferase YjiC (YdhE family)